MSASPDLTWHYVDLWAARKPEAEALVSDTGRLNWREFADQVDRIARALLEAGVERGDRVALLSMARNEFLPMFMAANKVGAMWLGLSPKFTHDELRYMLEDAGPKVLVGVGQYRDQDLVPLLRQLKSEVQSLEHLWLLDSSDSEMPSFEDHVLGKSREEMAPDLAARVDTLEATDDALLMYTSGSTGKPKGVVHTHSSILNNVVAQAEHLMFGENSRNLLHFPINHVAADVEIGFASVFAGSTVVHMEQFEPVETLKVIERERITVMGQVPVMFLLQMANPVFEETDFRSVQAFVWAGSAAPAPVIDALSAIASQTGAALVTGYGSTEVAGFVTYSRPGDCKQLLIESAGRVAEPFELKIVDDHRGDVPVGTTGEIAVRGPLLMDRFWGRPEDTAACKDEAGWYYTDDLAHLDDDGNIFIVGRKSERYKTGGENVYPREIEDVLAAHPNVQLSAVLGVSDPMYQEVGHAFVMPKPGTDLDAETLGAHCKEHLANFKVPKAFTILPMLPLLPTGKVNKVALRAQLPPQ
jgi:acyl-CoA synthetase (AMP-forming)/AMP-acid ligase II